MREFLAELPDFDFSVFLDEIVPASRKVVPECKNGGCIIISPSALKEKGLAVPASYEELLDPGYRGLISMPSPSSSGTGYMFLRQLVNEWGEDEAFAYFEKLTENILHYTSSGSGPVNDLIQGEAAIGLGMTAQAAVEIADGADLQIIFFGEGSPYSMVRQRRAEKERRKKGGHGRVQLFFPPTFARETTKSSFPIRSSRISFPKWRGIPPTSSTAT